jgi:FtsH-binding integral membrane protein
MAILRPQSAILAMLAFAGVVAIVVWQVRRLSLRGQFLALVALGVSIGFLVMIVVQLPNFPHWLAAGMIVVVFVAAPFATQTLMRSLKQEEQAQKSNENQSKS